VAPGMVRGDGHVEVDDHADARLDEHDQDGAQDRTPERGQCRPAGDHSRLLGCDTKPGAPRKAKTVSRASLGEGSRLLVGSLHLVPKVVHA
jgi:hypothetical protein